jgi:hypothetical protein
MTAAARVGDRRALVGATIVAWVHLALAVVTWVVGFWMATAEATGDGDQRGVLVVWYGFLAVACAATLAITGGALLRVRRAALPLLVGLTRTVRVCYWVAGGLVVAAVVAAVVGAMLSVFVVVPVIGALSLAPSSLWYLKNRAKVAASDLRGAPQ